MAVDNFRPIFEAAGKEWNVDPALLMAVAHQESGGNPKAVSPKGARGLMQIMPRTGQELGLADPHDPEQSIYAGAKYLSQMLDRFKRPELALAAYNAGPSVAQSGRFADETLKYVPAVTGHYKRFAASGQTANDASGAEDFDAIVKRTTAAPSEDFDALVKRTTKGAAEEDFDAIVKRTAAAPVAAASPAQQNMRNADPATGQPYAAGVPPQAPLAPIPGAAPDSPDAPSPSRVGQPAPSGPGVLSRVGNAIASPFVEGGALGPDTSTGSFYNGPMGLVNRLTVAAPLSALDAAGRGIQGVARGVGALGGAALEGMGFQGYGARFGRDVAQLPDALAGMVGVPAGRGVAANKLSGAAAIADDLAARNALGARVEAALPPGLAPEQRVATINRVVEEHRAPTPGATVGAPDATAGPRSVGASATPGELTNMSRAEMVAQRATAEHTRLNEPQPRGTDTTAYIEGVNPTEAQIVQNARVSRDEKSLAQRNPERFKEIAAANNEARIAHYDDLAGNQNMRQSLERERTAQAEQDLRASWKSKQPADIQPVQDKASEILNSPDGRRHAVRSAVDNVVKELTGADGKPITDPEMLYGVRKHIDDLLEAKGGDGSKVNARVQAQLSELKGSIDGVIEQAAPGFRQYLSNFAEASKPIDEMRMLQEARPAIFDAQNRISYAKVQGLLRTIVKERSSTAIGDAHSISDATMAKLWAMRDDLRRVASSDDLAKAAQSDTVQNVMDAVRAAPKAAVRLGLHATGVFTANPFVNLGAETLSKALAARNEGKAIDRALNTQNRLTTPRD